MGPPLHALRLGADNRLRRQPRHLLLAFSELAGEDLAYWAIDNISVVPAGEKDNVPVQYPDQVVDRMISEVRTDLDAFSEAEMKILENHGYITCANAIVPHIPGWVDHATPPFAVPHGECMNADVVRRELRDSHKRRRPLGRT